MSATNFNGTFTFSSLNQYRSVLNRELVLLDQNDPNNQYEAAWFVQDDIRLSPNFTLSLGLRHEFQSHLESKLNFAPRLGIAWSPFKDHKTTIRAGGGIFFNRLSGSLFENTLRFDGVTEQSIVIRNPLYPDPFAGDPVIDARNTITRTLDPNLKAPYVIDFISSVERQLPDRANSAGPVRQFELSLRFSF